MDDFTVAANFPFGKKTYPQAKPISKKSNKKLVRSPANVLKLDGRLIMFNSQPVTLGG